MGFKSVKNQFAKVKQKIKEEKENVGSSYTDNELFFKPQPVKGQEKTKYRVRFLQLDDESPSGRPWIEIRYHMFERQGDNKYIKVIDPRTFDPKAPNPIADMSSKLYGTGNELDKKMGSKLYRKPRYFSKVYIKEAPENQQDLVGQIRIYEASKTLYDKWMDEIEETEDDEAPFWDAFEGKDFLISVKEKGDWPDYSDSKFIGGAKPITDDEDEMEKIAERADKIRVKDTILEKDPLKSATELEELLTGGLKAAPKDKASKNGKDMITEEEITTDSVDFGEDDIEDTPATESKKEASSESKDKDEEFDDDELDDVDFSDEDFEV